MQRGVCLRDERGEKGGGRVWGESEGENVERQREESGHEKVLDAFESLFNVQRRRSGGEIFHS